MFHGNIADVLAHVYDWGWKCGSEGDPDQKHEAVCQATENIDKIIRYWISSDDPCADMGTYKNTVTVAMPWRDYWKEGNRAFASIDRCIWPEVRDLWLKGIKTVESCCGHGVVHGYIAVDDASISAMEALGYQHDSSACEPSFVFMAKTPCARTKEITASAS